MYELIRQNKRRSNIIVVMFTLIVILVASIAGEAFFGDPVLGGILGAVFGGIYTVLSVNLSNSSVIRLTNARKISKSDEDIDIKELQLVNIVSQLSMVAGIPEPEVYVINDSLPNAFAAGLRPEKALVGVTTGLLSRLDRDEIEGVVAHEIAHIANYDVRLSTMIYAMGGFLVMLGYLMLRGGSSRSSSNNKNKGNGALIAFIVGFVVYLFGEMFTRIIQLWVSRKREYLADATAAEYTRNPQALARALGKISGMDKSEVADKSMAAMYFVNPFKPNKEKDSMFSTHPTIKNRIANLQRLYTG